jgi:hypothetical protein
MRIITTHNQALVEAIKVSAQFSYRKICFIGKPSAHDRISY